jgi:hypothetical protein
MQSVEHADFHVPWIFDRVQQSYSLQNKILPIIQFDGMNDTRVQMLQFTGAIAQEKCQFDILKLHIQWLSRVTVQKQQNISIFRAHLCIQSMDDHL